MGDGDKTPEEEVKVDREQFLNKFRGEAAKPPNEGQLIGTVGQRPVNNIHEVAPSAMRPADIDTPEEQVKKGPLDFVWSFFGGPAKPANQDYWPGTSARNKPVEQPIALVKPSIETSKNPEERSKEAA